MTTQHSGEREVPPDTLAMRLVIARVHRGHYNVASAALAVGESRQTWANWERGKPMRHEDAVIAKIARALDVDEDWLRYGGPLGNDEAPRPDGPEGLGAAERYAIRDSNPEPADMVHSCPDLQLVA